MNNGERSKHDLVFGGRSNHSFLESYQQHERAFCQIIIHLIEIWPFMMILSQWNFWIVGLDEAVVVVLQGSEGRREGRHTPCTVNQLLADSGVDNCHS